MMLIVDDVDTDAVYWILLIMDDVDNDADDTDAADTGYWILDTGYWMLLILDTGC